MIYSRKMAFTAADAVRTALTNVRIFDGRKLSEPTTVVIDGSVIATDATGARRIDAGGAVLLPGFIDCHVHVAGPETPESLVAHGVTTALDMAAWPLSMLAAVRAVRDSATVRSAGLPIIGPGGPHAGLSGLAELSVIGGPAEAEPAVAARVAAGSDYIKLVLEAPGDGGPDPETAKAVVAAAHARDLLVVAHATTVGAYALGLDVGVDVITHVPTDAVLPDADNARMAAGSQVAVPTLTMMKGIGELTGRAEVFDAALATVGALYAAGIPVLAGTDANHTPGIPYQPPFGESIHGELELLVAAGLPAAAALEAATALPARHFRLPDRGAITPGHRADLILLDGDPLADIRATRTITRIWCGGIEYAPAGA